MGKKCQNLLEAFVLVVEPEEKEAGGKPGSSVLYRNSEDPLEGLNKPNGSALEKGDDE